jgi:hypothetical protein
MSKPSIKAWSLSLMRDGEVAKEQYAISPVRRIDQP